MAILTVTNGNDNGPGSLRNAILIAAPGDIIIFDPLVTVVMIVTSLIINKNLTIQGNGVGSTKITNTGSVEVAGMLNISATFTVNISGISIVGGTANSRGIVNAGITNIDNVVIDGHISIFNGAGITNGAPGTMTISNSTIENNISSGFGGGIFAVLGSILTTITHSTISTNTSSQSGGGISFAGTQGYLYNSTVYNNTAPLGLGIGSGGGLEISGPFTILNSTIVNNTTGGVGGGIRTFVTPDIGNTIVANNKAMPGSPDVFGNFNSLGYNLIGDTSGSTGFPATGDIIAVDPDLGPFQNNGGPTNTLLPNPGSPVIDAGLIANIPPGEVTDQRGYFRIVGASVDIGSVEANSSPICYSGNSYVLAKNILTNEISEVMARNIMSGIHEVYSISEDKFVPVVYNIVTGPTIRYMLIKKNSFGEDKPNNDFYITGGHKIIINGSEIKAADLPNAKRIKVKPELVYSICIENRGPIIVNNLSVMAWGKNEWLQKCQSKNISWANNSDKYNNLKKQITLEKLNHDQLSL